MTSIKDKKAVSETVFRNFKEEASPAQGLPGQRVSGKRRSSLPDLKKESTGKPSLPVALLTGKIAAFS